MDRIAIAGELRKPNHVGGGDGLRERLSHADREILEIENAQRQDHRTATVARIARMLHRGNGYVGTFLRPQSYRRSMLQVVMPGLHPGMHRKSASFTTDGLPGQARQ